MANLHIQLGYRPISCSQIKGALKIIALWTKWLNDPKLDATLLAGCVYLSPTNFSVGKEAIFCGSFRAMLVPLFFVPCSSSWLQLGSHLPLQLLLAGQSMSIHDFLSFLAINPWLPVDGPWKAEGLGLSSAAGEPMGAYGADFTRIHQQDGWTHWFFGVLTSFKHQKKGGIWWDRIDRWLMICHYKIL
jgi:hypothetical protein